MKNLYNVPDVTTKDLIIIVANDRLFKEGNLGFVESNKISGGFYVVSIIESEVSQEYKSSLNPLEVSSGGTRRNICRNNRLVVLKCRFIWRVQISDRLGIF